VLKELLIVFTNKLRYKSEFAMRCCVQYLVESKSLKRSVDQSYKRSWKLAGCCVSSFR